MCLILCICASVLFVEQKVGAIWNVRFTCIWILIAAMDLVNSV